MNIGELYSTKERRKLLCRLLMRPSQKMRTYPLARELGLSPGFVHKYAGILKKNGLADKGELLETPMARALRLTCNLNSLQEADVAGFLRKSFPKCTGIGVFGSWANGSNSESSDLDLWIKINEEPDDLACTRARRALEGKLGAAVDLVFATPQRLKAFKEKSESFYWSVSNGTVLWGEGL